MRLNLPNRFHDVIHVPSLSQEHILRQPDRRRADLPVAFQFLETLAPGFQPRGTEETLESARVDRLVEQAVKILFVIAARTGDSFGIQRLEEFITGESMEMFRVISEWIIEREADNAAVVPAREAPGRRRDEDMRRPG